MRWQTTVVVAILLVLVGGYYVVDVEYLGPRQEKREQAKHRVWVVEDKSVEELFRAYKVQRSSRPVEVATKALSDAGIEAQPISTGA